MVTAPATDDSPDWLDGDPMQAKVLEMFLNQMRGSWVWLARNVGEVLGHSVGQYSALLTAEQAERAVGDAGWDVHHGAGMPGFTQYYGDSPEVVYERNGSRGPEVLVYDRTWHGVRPDSVELAEDFRLLFNLWEDRPTRTYFDFDESGNSSKAVEITDEGVRVRTDLVRRYQAARHLWLGLYVDSTNWSTDLDAKEHRWEMHRDGLAIDYYRGGTTVGDKPFSTARHASLHAAPARDLRRLAV